MVPTKIQFKALFQQSSPTLLPAKNITSPPWVKLCSTVIFFNALLWKISNIYKSCKNNKWMPMCSFPSFMKLPASTNHHFVMASFSLLPHTPWWRFFFFFFFNRSYVQTQSLWEVWFWISFSTPSATKQFNFLFFKFVVLYSKSVP